MRRSILFLLLVASWGGRVEGATGRGGMAATIHPLATSAAIETLKQGGNAIDAAVAAAVTLGVVDSHDSGLGGGCFMLIRLADGRTIALDGREEAPARASRDMFVQGGKASLEASTTGALAIGIPGSLAVYEQAVQKYGKRTLKQLLEPAANLAERGFPIDQTFASRLAATAKELQQFPESAAIFLDSQKAPLKAGAMLKQKDLAESYRRIARLGSAWFYRGPFAQATEGWMASHGGLVRASDFANYTVKLREPIQSTYRGCQIIGFPPPSSGGVHVAQILNILDGFNLEKMGPNSPTMVHVVSEAMRLAFADRAFWLGDPAFTPVPRNLVSNEYATSLAKQIRLTERIPSVEHGTPPAAATDVFSKHTTHFSVADDQGNWVACTATINTSFGSKVVIPGTGILMNNQMDDFSTQPGVPNAFGLVGTAESNAVAPGKRPLSSMSPTIVLRDGQPILAVGAAGGPTIISQVVLALINHLDFHMGIEEALRQPRFHQQWSPDELRIERSASPETLEKLAGLGHQLRKVDALGAAQAVGHGSPTALFEGASDPRGLGQAQAVNP